MAANADGRRIQRILVAGATGNIGRRVVQELREHGHWVRVLTRHQRDGEKLGGNDVVSADIETGERLAVAFSGEIDAVFSALGNSTVRRPTADKSSFWDIDFRLNKQLVQRARSTGVRRFVYVSAFSGPGYANTAYIKAHEATADCVRESGLEYGIVRPTSVFSTLMPEIEQARRGRLPLLGDGTAFTNPIDDIDLARNITRIILSDSPSQDEALGGPQMLTRREIAEKIFKVLAIPPQFTTYPESILSSSLVTSLVRLADRRLGESLDYYAKVNTSNSVAPPVGTRSLDDFLAAAVETGNPFPVAERIVGGGQNWSLNFIASRKR
jgi:uncharacterized protein YbjT (DUF2867 family)